MLRSFLCLAAVLGLFAGGLLADDKTAKDRSDKTAKSDKNRPDKDKNARKATVTNVDAKKGTVTVKMKGKDGKEHERTFTLTEDVRMWDDQGNAAVIDVFRSGDYVLVVEREGKLKAIQKDKNGGKADTNKSGKSGASSGKKPGG